jgi:hypothetical protein
MNPDTASLGRANAGFALSAAITVLFNTFLACAKDADVPLRTFLASLSGSDWLTQGLTDVILFVLLGLLFRKPVGQKRSIRSA